MRNRDCFPSIPICLFSQVKEPQDRGKKPQVLPGEAQVGYGEKSLHGKGWHRHRGGVPIPGRFNCAVGVALEVQGLWGTLWGCLRAGLGHPTDLCNNNNSMFRSCNKTPKDPTNLWHSALPALIPWPAWEGTVCAWGQSVGSQSCHKPAGEGQEPLCHQHRDPCMSPGVDSPAGHSQAPPSAIPPSPLHRQGGKAC